MRGGLVGDKWGIGLEVKRGNFLYRRERNSNPTEMGLEIEIES